MHFNNSKYPEYNQTSNDEMEADKGDAVFTDGYYDKKKQTKKRT